MYKVMTAQLMAMLCFTMGAAAVNEDAIMEQRTVIDVTDFGAVPDNDEDDTLAVTKAIQKAHEVSNPVLFFPKGTYHFAEGANPEHPHRLFHFRGIENLTIDGDGSLLMFDGLVAPFHMAECSNLLIKNIYIDWVRPPFSSGEIIATGDKYFDVRVFEAYPVKGGEPVQAFQDFDPATRLPKRDTGLDVYRSVDRTELIAPQTLRVHTTWETNIEAGFLAVLRHQVYAYNAFYLHSCRDVQVQDITVYTTPGMGIVAEKCHNISLERFRVLIAPDSGRLMSATADGSHFGGCTGLIRIDDCEFEGMGDDAVNIKTGLYLIVEDIIDERTVVGYHPLGFQILPDPGDIMELSPTDTLLSYGEAIVASATAKENNRTEVVFQAPFPDTLKVGDVLGNASRVARAHISNTHVRSNRARGFLIQTRDALVEDCTFRDITTSGVFVMTEVVYFYESIAPHDVIVRNNTFINCGYTDPKAEGVIQVYAYLKDFAFPPKPGVIRNITIEGNTIQGGNNSGIFVTSTEGIQILNNKIEDVCRLPHRDESRSAIYIMSTRNVQITGNTAVIDQQGDGCDAVLTFGPGCDMDTIVVEGNTGF